MIFHLLYDFKGKYQSINAYIPKEKCTVMYRDLDHAIHNCLRLMKEKPNAKIWLAVSDLKSAFRMVPLSGKWWPYLIMKAQNSLNKTWYYFVDKCLPFGASISCAIFQRWSNVLAPFA